MAGQFFPQHIRPEDVLSDDEIAEFCPTDWNRIQAERESVNWKNAFQLQKERADKLHTQLIALGHHVRALESAFHERCVHDTNFSNWWDDLPPMTDDECMAYVAKVVEDPMGNHHCTERDLKTQ